MSYFIDRKATNINRRRLEIKDIQRDPSGEPVEIVADIFREEGNVSTIGTAMNAKELNAIITKMKDLIFFFVDIDNLIQPEGQLNVSWMQEKGNLKSKTFRVHLGKALHAKVSNASSRLNVKIINKGSYIDIEVKETTTLNNDSRSGTSKYDFSIAFYTNTSEEIFLKGLDGYVNYTFESTNPID